MRAVLAIALLSVRTAVRSRVVLSLLAVLLLLIAGLPLTVKGDGTLEGHVQIVIGYSLGLATFLLSISTLWSGCAAVSSEIAGKQIHLLVAKPVPRAALWLGKWLGLMLLNALLVAFCSGSTYALLRWTTQDARWSPADRARLANEVLIARREVRPVLPDLDLPARAELAARIQAGKVPENTDRNTLLDAIKMSMRAQTGAIGSGQRLSWDIALPHPPRGADQVTIRFRFAASALEINPVRTQWTVGTPVAPDRFRLERVDTPGAHHDFQVPAAAFADGSTLRIACGNIDPQGATLLFVDDDAIAVLLPAGTFAANFVRSALTLLGQLALFAAMGVTAGSIFSMPVASFASLFAVVVLSLGGMIHDLAGAESVLGTPRNAGGVAKAADTALKVLYTGMEAAIQPLEFEAPWDDLARSRWVSWGRVGRSLGINGALYGSLLWLLGMAVLNRREMALPSS